MSDTKYLNADKIVNQVISIDEMNLTEKELLEDTIEAMPPEDVIPVEWIEVLITRLEDDLGKDNIDATVLKGLIVLWHRICEVRK